MLEEYATSHQSANHEKQLERLKKVFNHNVVRESLAMRPNNHDQHPNGSKSYHQVRLTEQARATNSINIELTKKRKTGYESPVALHIRDDQIHLLRHTRDIAKCVQIQPKIRVRTHYEQMSASS